MKLNFKAILLAAMVTFMSVSCEEGILDRSPKWDDVVAEKVELTDVLFSDGERVRPYYLFSVKLGTTGATETSGVVLDAKFVSNELALHAATYAPAAGSERRNTYITGENGTKLIINGEAHQVVSGNIVITLADGNYSLSGVVKLDNEAVYDLGWTGGALSFGELPALTKLTTVLTAQSNAMMGAKTVTVKLGTEGLTSEFDMNTFQNVIKGTGSYLSVDFYSEDGYLAAGNYKPCADTANPQPGEYVIGYDFVSEWFSGENWGTCWWTVGAENTVAQKLTAGDIIVEMSAEKVYTVAIDNGELYVEFAGAIPALTKPDKPQGGGDTGSSVEEYPVLLSAGDQFEQYSQVVLQFASTDALTLDPATGAYSGTGKVFMLTINAAKDENGSLYIPTGEYAVDPQGASQPFTWQATGGMPEWNFYWGSLIYDVVNGERSVIELKEGTVWVGAKDGKYIINFESGDMKIRYTGAIQGLATPADDDGGYVGGDEGGSDDSTKLTQFFAVTDYYTMFGSSLVGVEVGTEGVTRTVEGWTTTYGGSGNYLKIEFYSADGKLAAGTYTASAENSPAEGEFGIGYDGQWGASGTTWYTVTDGELSYEYVTDGTAVVEVDGDTYTIKLESSVVNATYTGKLSAE